MMGMYLFNMQYSQLFCMTLSSGTTNIPLSYSPASFQMSVPGLLLQLFLLSSILLVNVRKPHLFHLKLFPKGTNVTSRQLMSSSCFASTIPRQSISSFDSFSFRPSSSLTSANPTSSTSSCSQKAPMSPRDSSCLLHVLHLPYHVRQSKLELKLLSPL
uniref:Uncharacterized protein n=1 Tax=Ditylum brightwellii TaxID=49249 RepID=A0A6V2EHI1_9STRA